MAIAAWLVWRRREAEPARVRLALVLSTLCTCHCAARPLSAIVVGGSSGMGKAAAVADDAVIEVIRKVADLDPIDSLDEWIEHVERPAVSLHYETMAALSQGFGTGIVGAWVGCWVG